MTKACGVILLSLAHGCGGSATSPTGSPTPVPSETGRPVGPLKRGPYLQHAAGGVAVVWYTDTPTQGRVRWFTGNYPSGPWTEVVSSAGTATRHEAVITPLQPGARYTYRVYSERGLLAGEGGVAEYYFRAPESDVLRFVVFGDSGLGTADQFAVARAIGNESPAPDLAMIVGDVVYPPFDDTAYDAHFFAPYRTLLPAIPFYAALGNHDYEYQAGKPFFDVFTLPRNGPAGLAPESSYWLERAGVLMIVHDTNQSSATLSAQSLPWHTETARGAAVFRLVFHHHSMYSSGPSYGQAPAGTLRALLAPVYTASGIDIVFNGHDHLYERTRAIGGVVYVTTGAGGAYLYSRNYTHSFTQAFSNDRFSYTFVEVRGRTLLLRQTDTEGLGIDALAITKPVAGSDTLRVLAGAESPPRNWTEPGFDDSAWVAASPTALGSAVRARKSFEVTRPEDVTEAVLRVRGVRDFVVCLNGVEVGRGAGSSVFPVPPSLLRADGNAVAVEGLADGDAGAPSLDLSLISSPR